ncbi:unnamed protein product [Diplocarpon coronariae]|uniref:2EXR domain-containing protein n=1 Tax=Diplocarpon coronariae TaxID=2795749 RepID=A0A218Z986_9HELO|nr:hypothetical protein B2J93_4451 [Marssonina coronariae]
MAAPASHPSLQHFHLFPHLPTEIRLKIYTLSLPNARLIPITYTHAPARTSAQSPTPQRPAREQAPRPHGLTSPTPLPSLLHTTHETRVHAQSFYLPLCCLGGSAASAAIRLNPQQDLVYFPAKEGYLASWKNFADTCTLILPAHLERVERLAVHEDVFLEEEKRRWRELEPGRAQLGLGLGLAAGPASRAGEGGIDGVTVKCIADFWEVVRRRFGGMREVWVLGEGWEERSWGNGPRDADGDGDGGMSLDPPRVGWEARKRRASFREKLARAVRAVEEASGWAAPRWTVLGAGSDDDGAEPAARWAGAGDGGVDEGCPGGDRLGPSMLHASRAGERGAPWKSRARA